MYWRTISNSLNHFVMCFQQPEEEHNGHPVHSSSTETAAKQKSAKVIACYHYHDIVLFSYYNNVPPTKIEVA